MITREELLSSEEHWVFEIQNQIFNLVKDYMEKEGINQTQLAERLGVSKGYVSQVLNGDFDHRISKLVSLVLATGNVPKLNFKPLDEVLQKDYLKRNRIIDLYAKVMREKPREDGFGASVIRKMSLDPFATRASGSENYSDLVASTRKTVA
ncbi:MAG: helix-turn-helix transcriptional regulator [Bacteroidia bacterium]|nr:helix-turn-helix transcriptional regulator [Bacteroidia bacterium]